jgi:subtilisin family serine protease
MKRSTFSLHPKASVSLMAQLQTESRRAIPVRRMLASPRTVESAVATNIIPLILEATKAKSMERYLQNLSAGESAQHLAGGFYSLHVSPARARTLLDVKELVRLQTKKPSKRHLEAALPEAKVLGAGGTRVVTETGQGVLIGIVDSGFDLSHPMFRDAAGKLRVDALLDQNTGQEFTNAQLETGWANGTNPGADQHGHGTHVASIAGGSSFQGREGVAPNARFLLVKTDFQNTDNAVAFIFQKAGNKPCVINMSLGHHFGAHDGTDAEERFHDTITGPGKIVVISAGNEANDPIHLGGRFSMNQARSAQFDFLSQGANPPFVAVTAWYDAQDTFEGSLVTPSGQNIAIPAIGAPAQQLTSSVLQIDLSRSVYAFNNLIQIQVQIVFLQIPSVTLVRGWGLRFVCPHPVIGRLDAWFQNSGFAIFRNAPLVETARTVGLSATGHSSIGVASYVSKNQWDADDGHESDSTAVPGRISAFSSVGPTRDGREKPDLAAPGHFITAALATGSREAADDERADTAHRLLTIEGTSMAAPMVTGIVALMLQKRPTLTPAQAKQILFNSASKDLHTGPLQWTPHYGHGKIDATKALQLT